MDTTATVKTILPHSKPIANGIVPIAACTVAFGVYANMQKNRSFFVKFVLRSDTNTPDIRKIRANATSKITAIPADNA